MSPRSSVLLTLAVLALAACGEEISPRERLAAAPEGTAREGTSAFTMEAQMEMGREASGMTMTLSGDGVMDLASGRGRMSMDLPGMASALTMVFDSSDVYLRPPAVLQEGERQWIRQGRGVFGADGGFAYGGGPSGWWKVLEDVQGEIYELGPDVVRGTDVRGFSFTVSGEALWAGRENVPEDLKVVNVPVVVWLDAQDRLRRTTVMIDMGVVERSMERMADSAEVGGKPEVEKMIAAMSGTMKVTTEYFDFGTRLQVELPDSTEVTDVEELRRKSFGSSGGG